MFRDPKSFQAGSQVWVSGAFDCANCEVTSSQPRHGNDIVVELYELLPPNFGEWTGSKHFTMHDVVTIFRMFDVPREIWDDLYMRLTHFHTSLMEERAKWSNKAAKKKKTDGGAAP